MHLDGTDGFFFIAVVCIEVKDIVEILVVEHCDTLGCGCVCNHLGRERAGAGAFCVFYLMKGEKLPSLSLIAMSWHWFLTHYSMFTPIFA